MAEAKPSCRVRRDVAVQDAVETKPALVASEMVAVLTDFVLAFP